MEPVSISQSKSSIPPFWKRPIGRYSFGGMLSLYVLTAVNLYLHWTIVKAAYLVFMNTSWERLFIALLGVILLYVFLLGFLNLLVVASGMLSRGIGSMPIGLACLALIFVVNQAVCGSILLAKEKIAFYSTDPKMQVIFAEIEKLKATDRDFDFWLGFYPLTFNKDSSFYSIQDFANSRDNGLRLLYKRDCSEYGWQCDLEKWDENLKQMEIWFWKNNYEKGVSEPPVDKLINYERLLNIKKALVQ